MSFVPLITSFVGVAVGVAVAAYLMYNEQRRYNEYHYVNTGRVSHSDYSSAPRRRPSPVENRQTYINQENSQGEQRRNQCNENSSVPRRQAVELNSTTPRQHPLPVEYEQMTRSQKKNLRRRQNNGNSSTPGRQAVEFNSTTTKQHPSPGEHEQKISKKQETSLRPKKRRDHKQDICVICQRNVYKGFITECKHKYHYNCIKKWKCESNLCPVCRTPMKADTINPASGQI